MPDKDLAQALNTFSSWDFIHKTISEAEKIAASAFGQAVADTWLTSKIYVIFFVLLFFVIKFWERGIGSLIYNLIYFSIVAILIMVYGWEIIFNFWFEFISLFSYWLAGCMLRKIRPRNIHIK
ncbi:MAG: hypothetical protein WC545_00475 [Patescibacteria group bacterium]